MKEFNSKKKLVNMQIVDTYMRKMKEKMKRTKFKLFKIVINNEKGKCLSFERKNNHFNDRLHNYLNSYSFFEKNKNYHRNFHFSKSDLNLGHDFKKHYIKPYNPKQNTKLTSNLVLELLNEEDKKMIYSDPYFFLKDNKYLYKLTNTKFKSLLYRLQEEEKNNLNNNLNTEIKESETNENANKKEILKLGNQSSKTINIKTKNLTRNRNEEDGMKFYNKKYIDKIINEDLNRRLKEKHKNRNEKVEKEMINTVAKLNTYKKKDYIFESNNNYFKSFNEKTNENFFKSFSLNKNKDRLIREDLFHKQRFKQNTNDNEEQDIILKYQKILESIYKIAKEDNY